MTADYAAPRPLDEEHERLHERFDRLHGCFSAAVALLDFHAQHGCDRKVSPNDGSQAP